MEKIILTTKDELENIFLSMFRKALGESKQISEQDQDKIFTIQEACEYLNLAQQTLYGFTSKREIPFIKRGKKLYFRKSELKSWLLEGKKKTKDEIVNDKKRN
jgi:excisionase family DNA binding protein